MKKISQSLYDRLYLQASFAKESGNDKLANRMFTVIGSLTEESEQNPNEIIENAKSSLLNCLIDLADLYNKEDIDISEMNSFIEDFVNLFVKKSKDHLKVD